LALMQKMRTATAATNTQLNTVNLVEGVRFIT